MKTAKPFRTYELNLLVTGGWLSTSCEISEPVSMAFPRGEEAPKTSIGLPAFICWLNYVCVRSRGTQ